MSGYADEALSVLKAHGYRITKPRQRVVNLLAETDNALSPYEIKEKLDAAGAHVDTVSIYRILECLEENQLIHRVLTTGKVRRCDLEQEDHCALDQTDHCHHNLVCRACGNVQEVHCPGVENLIAAVATQSGFRIEQHHLEFSGVCMKCA
ncbi:MAG: transcriptional repressor [Candidatus Sericytochromatia bacterium]|nr:transcriptional repressor [Candidatus Sericytochromatia bacterium]